MQVKVKKEKRDVNSLGYNCLAKNRDWVNGVMIDTIQQRDRVCGIVITERNELDVVPFFLLNLIPGEYDEANNTNS